MATIISLAKAKSLTQEYQQQNAAEGGPGLLTPDTQFLNGFFIDRATLEDMLSDTAAVGVCIDIAKDAAFVGQPVNIFNLVMVGAKPNLTGVSGYTYAATGNIYSDVPPCPTLCTYLG
jgi:hypothetical protein